jgi:hypothetical protein
MVPVILVMIPASPVLLFFLLKAVKKRDVLSPQRMLAVKEQ